MKKKSYSRFRLEELPVVADLLLCYLDNDRSEFLAFSDKFNVAYSRQVSEQILKVRKLIPAKIITSERVKVTEELYYKMDIICMKLNFVQAYAEMANGTMNVQSTDFGIRKSKQQLKARNVEGALSNLKVVEQNINGNLEALQTKGFKNDLFKEIFELRDNIARLNLFQIGKSMERSELVAKNHREYERLWNYITEISRIGKLVLAHNKSKMSDYKFCKLLTHVRKT